ncbi:hypothetical protein BJV77DRAFT_983062 [Russula vinacea]|nr:hypothetical protein BJV77DRAFT_983062 [Russula vinacea]
MMSTNSPKEFLKQFISRNPNAQYSFDSERNASQSEICRQGKNKECIIVRLSVHENIRPGL